MSKDTLQLTPENAAEIAEMAVPFAKDAGASLDFTPLSLKEVDAIIEGCRADHEVSAMTKLLVSFGCYLGEVLVRQLGGHWIHTAGTPMAQATQWPIVVALPDGTIANPIGKTFKRFQNGAEDSLAPYFVFLTRREQLTGKASGAAASLRGWPTPLDSKGLAPAVMHLVAGPDGRLVRQAMYLVMAAKMLDKKKGYRAETFQAPVSDNGVSTTVPLLARKADGSRVLIYTHSEEWDQPAVDNLVTWISEVRRAGIPETVPVIVCGRVAPTAALLFPGVAELYTCDIPGFGPLPPNAASSGKAE